MNNGEKGDVRKTKRVRMEKKRRGIKEKESRNREDKGKMRG